MLLFEILNKPGQWKEVSANHGGLNAKMVMPDGRTVDYSIAPDYYTSNVYELVFAVDDNTGITGKGGELVIFSTAIDVLNHFFQKNSNAVVMFSASEESRARLYNRIVNKKLQPGFTSFVSDPAAHDEDMSDAPVEFYVGKPASIDQAIQALASNYAE